MYCGKGQKNLIVFFTSLVLLIIFDYGTNVLNFSIKFNL